MLAVAATATGQHDLARATAQAATTADPYDEQAYRDQMTALVRGGLQSPALEAYAVAENLNPVGRVYYNFSTFLCVPNALSQPGGYALGAQAGEKAIHQLCTDAGFTRFRRVGETPFNLVYEARL